MCGLRVTLNFDFILTICLPHSTQYVLDILDAGIAGTSCLEAAIQAMNTSVENVTLVDQTFCRFETGTAEWFDDPCCNEEIEVFILTILIFFEYLL